MECKLLVWAWTFVPRWPAELRIVDMADDLGSSEPTVQRAVSRLVYFGWWAISGDTTPGRARLYVWRLPDQARVALDKYETKRRQMARGRAA
jgi:DNA-binding transcriptional regulator PaaX